MGKELDYTLIRSEKRKTMAISVDMDLTVIVRAPASLGKKRIDAFVQSNQQWIARQIERQKARHALARRLTPDEMEQMRQLAKTVLPQRVAYYSKQMGLQPTGVRITSAKKRLGSCSGTNALNFSFRVMGYPMEAIDYVVVHELAHIRHKNHGAKFYELIAAYLPDFKQRVEQLKDPRYLIL